MPRVNLQVPFNEKDAAKRLGARWDGDGKVWYVPDGVDIRPFSNWLPDASESTICVKAKSYFIAEASAPCWKCARDTRIFGFLLPAGTEVLEPDDEAEDDDRSIWVVSDTPLFVHYVTDILISTVARMKTLASSFRLDFSQTTQDSYWMNHCDHCGMKQGDFGIYCEPQGAFLPMNEQEASKIVLHAVNEPFVCNGSYGFDVELFDYMRQT